MLALVVVAVAVKTTTAAEVVLELEAAALEVESGEKTGVEVFTTAGEDEGVVSGFTEDDETAGEETDTGLMDVLVKGEVETEAGMVKPCRVPQAAGSSPLLQQYPFTGLQYFPTSQYLRSSGQQLAPLGMQPVPHFFSVARHVHAPSVSQSRPLSQ